VAGATFSPDGQDPAAEESTSRPGERVRRTSGEYRLRWQATLTTCGSEDLLERQIFTRELDPQSAALQPAEEMRSAWSDCRWKAMGEP
jgi:hypothetical protein